MGEYQRIYVVDRDETRRAHMAKISYEAGIHAEPCQDVTEFAGITRQDGLVLCADDQDTQLVERVHLAGARTKLSLPTIAYSANPTPDQIVRAMLNGALSYLVWPIDEATLREAMKLEPRQLQLANLRSKQAEARAIVASLSRREQEVLREMTLGRSNKEIARSLDISHRTVEVHRANLFRKLDLKSSSDAVRVGVYASLDEEIPEAAAAA